MTFRSSESSVDRQLRADGGVKPTLKADPTPGA